MAIRYVRFQVSNGTTVTPASPQYGGVQGEHNATQVAFAIETDGPLVHPDYRYYIECVDAAGGYDRTAQLFCRDGVISTLVPLAWTQYGGVSIVRLVVECTGTLIYSLEGRLQFEERGAAIEKVDGLLRTDLTETLDACHEAVEDCRAEKEAAHEEMLAAGAAAADARASAEAADATHRAMLADVAEAQADMADAIDALPTLSDAIDENTVWHSRYMADTLCPALNVSGNPVTCHPLKHYPLWVTATHPNLLTPFSAVTLEKNGLTFTPAADGTVTVNGTATASTDYLLIDTEGTHSPVAAAGIEEGTALLFSGCPAGGGMSNYYLFIALMPSVPGATYMRQCTGAAQTITTVANDCNENYRWQCGIRIAAGTVCQNLVFRPRLTRTDTLTLAIMSPTATELKELAPNKAVKVNAIGGKTTFRLKSAGTVTVTGRQDVEAYCGDFGRALDEILALQEGLLGGEGV